MWQAKAGRRLTWQLLKENANENTSLSTCEWIGVIQFLAPLTQGATETGRSDFFPKALRRVLPENPLNTDTLPLTLRHSHLHTHTHWKSESIQVRSMPVSKYASVSMQA